LRNKKLLGKTVAEACEAVNIIFNYNAIPKDPNPPFHASGVRIGTPGSTSRGMKEKEMKLIAKKINEVVNAVYETKARLKCTDLDERKKEVRQQLIEETKVLKSIQQEIKALCKQFPIIKSYL
jgi:glycine hydroxymethyltransferase